MNDLMINSTTMTMSSLDIAKLVESRHDSVKRTIERCVEKGAINQTPMVDGPKSANQVTIKVYNLEKRDSFVEGLRYPRRTKAAVGGSRLR